MPNMYVLSKKVLKPNIEGILEQVSFEPEFDHWVKFRKAKTNKSALDELEKIINDEGLDRNFVFKTADGYDEKMSIDDNNELFNRKRKEYEFKLYNKDGSLHSVYQYEVYRGMHYETKESLKRKKKRAQLAEKEKQRQEQQNLGGNKNE